MEYISSEEFLKQSKEVQQSFIDWWKPSEGDIYSYIDLGERCRDCISQRTIQFFKRTCNKITITLKEWLFKKRKDCIPLLTEGQIRTFIEDKTKCKLSTEYYNGSDILIRFIKDKKEIKSHMFYYCNDLLQAYWKVAIQIASSEVKYER